MLCTSSVALAVEQQRNTVHPRSAASAELGRVSFLAICVKGAYFRVWWPTRAPVDGCALAAYLVRAEGQDRNSLKVFSYIKYRYNSRPYDSWKHIWQVRNMPTTMLLQLN